MAELHREASKSRKDEISQMRSGLAKNYSSFLENFDLRKPENRRNLLIYGSYGLLTAGLASVLAPAVGASVLSASGFGMIKGALVGKGKYEIDKRLGYVREGETSSGRVITAGLIGAATAGLGAAYAPQITGWFTDMYNKLFGSNPLPGPIPLAGLPPDPTSVPRVIKSPLPFPYEAGGTSLVSISEMLIPNVDSSQAVIDGFMDAFPKEYVDFQKLTSDKQIEVLEYMENFIVDKTKDTGLLSKFDAVFGSHTVNGLNELPNNFRVNPQNIRDLLDYNLTIKSKGISYSGKFLDVIMQIKGLK